MAPRHPRLRHHRRRRDRQDRMRRLDRRPDRQQRQRRWHEERRPVQDPLSLRSFPHWGRRPGWPLASRDHGRAALPRPPLGFLRNLRQGQRRRVFGRDLPVRGQGHLGLWGYLCHFTPHPRRQVCGPNSPGHSGVRPQPGGAGRVESQRRRPGGC